MKKYKVVFSGTLDDSIKDKFVEEALPGVDVVFISREETPENISTILQEADFLVIHKSYISPRELLEKATSLKFMQTFSVGTTHIPIQSAADRGILVSYAGNITAQSVAEHTILLILATLKRLMPAVDTIRNGRMNAAWNVKFIHRIEAKVVGIVGFGNIGQAVARMIRGLGASVIYFDIRDIPEYVTDPLQARRVTFDDLLSIADIVTLHLSLTDDTRQIIGWNQLIRMKPSAILVNTGRGALVDESALIRALRERKIIGAGLDVFEMEPPELNNPLLHMDNVVTTPHIASEVWEDYMSLIKLTWENISLVLAGKKPRNLVTPQ